MRHRSAILLLVASLAAPATARAQPAPTPAGQPGGAFTVAAAAAILVDGRNGRVRYAKDVHARRAPASLTKIVTALAVRDRYSLEDVVTVGDAAANVRGAGLGIEPGMRFAVRDLLYALLLVSGNDVAEALAAHDPQGGPGFITAMNDKARELGARDSAFANPHGLDQEGHFASAWDLALFTRALLDDPVLAEIVRAKTYPFPWPDGSTRVLQNHNKLLWRYEGTVGVKTGFTNQAGRCLVAALGGQGGEVVTVVMGSPDHYADTSMLFDFAKTSPPVVADIAPVVAAPPVPLAAAVAGGTVRDRVDPLATGYARYRWVAFPMALLAASMLLTLRRPRRRRSPILDAAQFHHYLEPLAEEPK